MSNKKKMSHSMSIPRYLSENFTSSFLTIFLPLFFIGSLVFIIKLSALTASIQVTFLEMMQLFSYNLPSILFYTLPISFLVAVVVTLLRLSNENELIALVALGSNAKVILRTFLGIATLFTVSLLILSIGLIPKTKQQFKAFQHEKTTQAQANINPSKLGQKFGNLFVYLESKTNNTMKNIVIYNKDKERSDQLFMAKEATVETKNSVVTLSLKDGSGYTFSPRALKEINYEKMQIFQNLNAGAFTYNSILDYWLKLSLDPKGKRRILFFIFISFIPIMALYTIAAFSIINPRYQKNYAYYILGVVTIALYAIAGMLEKSGNFITLFLALLISFFIGIYLFKRFVLRYF